MAYPPSVDHCPFQDVKVVIVGVHPYGYSFDAKRDLNFNKLIGKYDNDTGLPYRAGRRNWSLSAWRDRGVCMLERRERHTTEALSCLSVLHSKIVFIVFGRAKIRIPWIIETGPEFNHRPFDHLIITDDEDNIFSKANQFLVKHGKQPINWRLEG